MEPALKLARENVLWGYHRIQSALGNLGNAISDTAVANILKAHGIEPVPDRKPQSTWKNFLKAHWDALASVDFTTIEVWTRSGLATYYLLFFMELATRRVHLAGLTATPDEDWMLEVARNVTDAEQGFLCGKQYLLMDRDAKFSRSRIPPDCHSTLYLTLDSIEGKHQDENNTWKIGLSVVSFRLIMLCRFHTPRP